MQMSQAKRLNKISQKIVFAIFLGASIFERRFPIFCFLKRQRKMAFVRLILKPLIIEVSSVVKNATDPLQKWPKFRNSGVKLSEMYSLDTEITPSLRNSIYRKMSRNENTLFVKMFKPCIFEPNFRKIEFKDEKAFFSLKHLNKNYVSW